MCNIQQILRMTDDLGARIGQELGLNEGRMRIHCALLLLMAEAPDLYQVTEDQKTSAVDRAARWDKAGPGRRSGGPA